MRRCQTRPRTDYAYGLGSRLLHQSFVFRSSHCLWLLQYCHKCPCRTYEYVLASAPRSRSCCRQCRKHLVMVPQTTPAAGSGRPHDVRKGIIRRQGGRLPRCSIQRVRMGLRATGSPCLSLSCDLAPLATSCRICRARSGTVAVRGHLLRGKRRGADSAGKTFLIAAMRHNQELFHASSYRSSR